MYYQAATLKCIKQVDRKLANIDRMQTNTARLREETWEILNRVKAMLEL